MRQKSNIYFVNPANIKSHANNGEINSTTDFIISEQKFNVYKIKKSKPAKTKMLVRGSEAHYQTPSYMCYSVRNCPLIPTSHFRHDHHVSAACAARIWPFHPHTSHKRHASSTKPKPHLPAAQTPVQQRTYTTAHSLNLCPRVLSYLSGVENESKWEKKMKGRMNWGNLGNVTITYRCKMKNVSSWQETRKVQQSSKLLYFVENGNRAKAVFIFPSYPAEGSGT